MQIGIGSVYDTLPRWRSAGGHSVAVENLNGAEDVRPLADEIGAIAVDANGDLAEADPIIRSIPRPAPANLPQYRFDMIVHDVSVVDAMGFDACTRTQSWRRQPPTPDYCCGHCADANEQGARPGQVLHMCNHLAHHGFSQRNRSANPVK